MFTSDTSAVFWNLALSSCTIFFSVTFGNFIWYFMFYSIKLLVIELWKIRQWRILNFFCGHFLHVYLKDSCPLPPSCMEWGVVTRLVRLSKWEFAFMDRQALFKDLNESWNRRKNQWIISIQFIDTPTPEKPKGVFEINEEDEHDSLSLASYIGYYIFLLVFVRFLLILHRYFFW